MAIKATEISDLIKQRIENFQGVTEARNVGTIVSVTDGIVRVHGLADARYGEMLEFPGNTFGLALNLEQDSVGAVVLGDPHVSTEQLSQLVTDLAGANLGAHGRNFVQALAEARRLDCLPEISALFDGYKDDAEGIADVTVTSAAPLDAKQQQTLTAALTRRLKREVRLHCTTDPELLGGAVLRSGDLVIDGSVRGRLERIANDLKES
jgi:ATP synthase F1 delta subunit